jgi:hypothetical protein
VPLLLIGLGVAFILTGATGNPAALWSLIEGDFSGSNNFVYWMLSILVLGALGYVDSIKSLSRLFIILIVIVLLLDNNGFFANLQQFINSTSSSSAAGGTQNG